MTYIKDYTNTYIFHGHQYTIIAPALWDEKTNKVVDISEHLLKKALILLDTRYQNILIAITLV
ncbi:hypothetical protein HMPREF0548_0516 [Lactobacillus ultunensis DSM 16047]|uniref:Uncharacterized protein n=1 Tax=Lactobacillus ultunensis DSM 16047 TaxID=525365 RepID=C2ELH0_9LACO|nr:hypothetical protein HMPREF0548_0516 [Lactobacillus ultunensis DSM 16047]